LPDLLLFLLILVLFFFDFTPFFSFSSGSSKPSGAPSNKPGANLGFPSFPSASAAAAASSFSTAASSSLIYSSFYFFNFLKSEKLVLPSSSLFSYLIFYSSSRTFDA